MKYLMDDPNAVSITCLVCVCCLFFVSASFEQRILRYKVPNEIGNHRQISPYTANYRNKLHLFMHKVRMLITSEIPDHVVVFLKKMM